MIRIATSGSITTLTLDRPDKANALTEAMLTDLIAAVIAAKDAAALILTGTGKVFSVSPPRPCGRNSWAPSMPTTV